MLELISLLEKSGRTIRDDLTRWFQPYLPGGVYYLVSDYCLNDAGKNHDVYAFEIVRNHDTRDAKDDWTTVREKIANANASLFFSALEDDDSLG